MKFGLFLFSLGLAGASAFALNPDSFKGQAQVFQYRVLSTDHNQICESLGLSSTPVQELDQVPYYPLAATWLRTQANQLLAFGSCYKDGAEIKILSRFLADSTRDMSFTPLLFRNDLYPKLSCSEKSFVESPAGEFFITLNCERPDTNKTKLVQKMMFKLNKDGVLDESFGQSGKLVLDKQPVGSTVTSDKPGFLQDGTVVDESCQNSTPRICTIYNFSAATGAVLGQKTMEYHLSIRTPFHFEDLGDGILREETLPICTGGNCLYTPVWGVSTGIATFKDFLNRRPVIDPHPTNTINFTPFYYADALVAPFWRPEGGQPGDIVDFLQFELSNNRYNLVMEANGPIRRVTLVDGFTPEIPFTEPFYEVVQRTDFELDLTVKQSEQMRPLDPVNRMLCEPTAKFGDGILVTCREIDPTDKPVGLALVAFDRDMRLKKNFGDHGYFRPQGLDESCLEDRFTSIEVRDHDLRLQCDNASFNGDFSITFSRSTYFFQ